MGYCRCTLLEALNGVRHWVAAVKKLNKRPVSVLQFYTASTIHSFWQKNSMKKPDKLRLFTPNFSALSLYRRQERWGLSCSGHCCLTRSTEYSPRSRKQVKACFSRLLSSCKQLWGFFSLIVSFLQTFYSLLTGSYIVSCFDISAVYRLLQLRSVLPGPDKHSRPQLPKTTAIFEAFTATCFFKA